VRVRHSPPSRANFPDVDVVFELVEVEVEAVAVRASDVRYVF